MVHLPYDTIGNLYSATSLNSHSVRRSVSLLIAVSMQGPEKFPNTHSTLIHSLNGHSLLRITAITTSGSRARGEPGTWGTCPPLSRDLFCPALSLALLCMRACRSARAAAHTCVGGDPTNAYLYCIYALVRGAISIHDLYICAVSRVCANN